MNTSQFTAPAALPGNRVLMAFLVATVLAGANAVAVRFTVAELPPFWGAGMRFTGAGLLFWSMAVLTRRPLPTRAELGASVLYGVIGFGIAYALLYWGIQSVSAGMAQTLLASTPLLTFLFALLHRLESFHWRGLAGALIAAAGIGVSFQDAAAGPGSLLRMVAIVGGAACFAESTVVIKRLPKPDPVLTNAVGMTAGAALLLAFSRLLGEPWQLPTIAATWLSVAYLVAVGSVIVFYLTVYVIGHWTASASSYMLVLMPFVTVALGAWLAGEEVGSWLVLGGALVLIGVWIGAIWRPAKSPRRERAAASAQDD